MRLPVKVLEREAGSPRGAAARSHPPAGRRRGDRGDGYRRFDPRGCSLNPGGNCWRLGWSAARFGSLEEKIGFTSEDDGLAI